MYHVSFQTIESNRLFQKYLNEANLLVSRGKTEYITKDTARNKKFAEAIAITYKEEKMDVERYQALFAELEKYERAGIRIRLNSRLASPMQVVNAYMVNEESSYMRDYVCDEKGSVQELAFDNIEDC